MSQQPAKSDYLNQIVFLKKSIDDKISYCEKKRTRNKRGAIIARVLIVACSIVSTVLIGWKLSNEINHVDERRTDLTNFALLASVFTTALTTLDGFFDYKIMWTGYSAAIAELQLAGMEVEYLKTKEKDEFKQKELDMIFKRYKEICESLIQNYKATRLEKD